MRNLNKTYLRILGIIVSGMFDIEYYYRANFDQQIALVIIKKIILKQKIITKAKFLEHFLNLFVTWMLNVIMRLNTI